MNALSLVLVDEHRFDTTHMRQLTQVLSDAERHPLTAEVHDRTDPANRNHFVAALLKLWLSTGAPAKLSWLMIGAGWLGGPKFINILTPMVWEWLGVSQYQRAVEGLTALRNIASDEALQQVSRIAAKVKFARLRKRAGRAMDKIAAQRGFSRDESEDCIIPDGGFDEHDTRVFDYGTCRFLTYVAPESKPAARLLNAEGHPTGEVLSTLPAPNKSDGIERAKAMRAGYNLVKKAVTTLAKI